MAPVPVYVKLLPPLVPLYVKLLPLPLSPSTLLLLLYVNTATYGLIPPSPPIKSGVGLVALL
jgi:hypothetical protein